MIDPDDLRFLFRAWGTILVLGGALLGALIYFVLTLILP